MKLFINKVFESADGLTAVSINRDAFKAITGRYPAIKESHFEKADADTNIRTFAFDNAELITKYNKKTNKTVCLVRDTVVASLPRSEENAEINATKLFGNVDWSKFNY